MTNEKAIKMLEYIKLVGNGESEYKNDAQAIAIDMAIEALKKRPTGKWIKTSKAVMGEGYMWYCDNCEHQVYQDKSKDYPSEKYCPSCGHRMVEPQENEGGKEK